jgi:hypothetical protein
MQILSKKVNNLIILAVAENIDDISNLLEKYILNEAKYGNGTETSFGVQNDTDSKMFSNFR